MLLAFRSLNFVAYMEFQSIAGGTLSGFSVTRCMNEFLIMTRSDLRWRSISGSLAHLVSKRFNESLMYLSS